MADACICDVPDIASVRHVILFNATLEVSRVIRGERSLRDSVVSMHEHKHYPIQSLMEQANPCRVRFDGAALVAKSR